MFILVPLVSPKVPNSDLSRKERGMNHLAFFQTVAKMIQDSSLTFPLLLPPHPAGFRGDGQIPTIPGGKRETELRHKKPVKTTVRRKDGSETRP